ncbi:MAG: glutamate 5-kinase [Bacteroidetes bacterium]|nr:MAG: glutamate 5-kinase [Bacteroidota bacterium]
MEKPLIVLKIGTSSITRKDGSLDEPVLVEVARQVARLHASYRFVIVSSGAVGTGKGFLKNYSGSISERKAAAAIGNPLLINKYAQFFSPYNIPIAQSLCERQHFSNRRQFLQLRQTFEELWANDIIPIANENDVVSNFELRFSDNDELATLIATGFGASSLLLGTAVPGLYDRQGQIISRLDRIDEEVMGLAYKETSALGLGGMISKLTFARLATRMGIKVVIFGIRTPEGIVLATREATGTVCTPQPSSLSLRNKWLASGSLVSGRVVVDKGACKALKNRKSLLAVGILQVAGDFMKGEVFEIVCEDTPSFALARSRMSSAQLQQQLGRQNVEVAHADDIVLL